MRKREKTEMRKNIIVREASLFSSVDWFIESFEKKEEEGKSTTMIEIMMKWTSPVRINIDSRQFCFPLSKSLYFIEAPKFFVNSWAKIFEYNEKELNADDKIVFKWLIFVTNYFATNHQRAPYTAFSFLVLEKTEVETISSRSSIGPRKSHVVQEFIAPRKEPWMADSKNVKLSRDLGCTL